MRGLERSSFVEGWVGRISYWIFHRRRVLLILFVLITIVLGAMASQLRVQAGFTKMIPLNHEYMQTFLEYQADFGGANRVLVAVKNRGGTIFEKEFMDTLRQVTEEVFFINGVERSSVTSLFTPNVRYNEVVEDGFRGGNIVGADFDGSPEQLAKVRENLLKSDWVGRIVANDQTAAMVVATLQENDPQTGERLNLQDVAKQLEAIRGKYESESTGVHIIGFAKAMGDIAKGAAGVLLFFGIAFVITAVLLYWYSGSLVLTVMALICAIVPVVWLLGLLPVFGLGLDPMSILVPFLIFSIAVSHAVQMTNAWKLETLHGADGITASRASFQKLFIPGAMALLANALGFMVIAFVDIEIVRELALTATIGVTVMIITNKMLLPILMSYYKFTPEQASKLAGKETAGDWLWERISPLATRKFAWASVLVGGAAARIRHLEGTRPAHRRSRQGRPRAEGRFALQPGRRHDHEPLRDRRRPAAGDRGGQARERGGFPLRQPRRHGSHGGFRLPDAPGRRRRHGAEPDGIRQIDHPVVRRDLRQVANAAGGARADRAGRRLRDASRQRADELTLHGDAGQHLHDRSPGDDHRAHRREDQGIQGRKRRHGADPVPPRERQRRRHGRDQRGGGSRRRSGSTSRCSHR